jgi:hypothetical protein
MSPETTRVMAYGSSEAGSVAPACILDPIWGLHIGDKSRKPEIGELYGRFESARSSYQDLCSASHLKYTELLVLIVLCSN